MIYSHSSKSIKRNPVKSLIPSLSPSHHFYAFLIFSEFLHSNLRKWKLHPWPQAMLGESSWDWAGGDSCAHVQEPELPTPAPSWLHPDLLHPGLCAGEARALHRKTSFLRVGGVGQVPPELLPGGATPNLRATEPRWNFPPFPVFLQLVVEEKVSVECWCVFNTSLNTYFPF